MVERKNERIVQKSDNKKALIAQGVNGGVVNLNGIKHTKSQTLQSPITGNLQGILSCFSPLIPSCLT